MKLLKVGKKREYYKFGEYPSKSYDKKYFNIFYHDEIAIYVDGDIELRDELDEGLLSTEKLIDIERSLKYNHMGMTFELYALLKRHVDNGGSISEFLREECKKFKIEEENKIQKDKMIQEYQRKIKNLEAINEEQEKNIISDKSSVIKIFIGGVLVGILIVGVGLFFMKGGSLLWLK